MEKYSAEVAFLICMYITSRKNKIFLSIFVIEILSMQNKSFISFFPLSFPLKNSDT